MKNQDLYEESDDSITYSYFLAGFTAILGKLISIGAISLVWWRLVITVISSLDISDKQKKYQLYQVITN
jgi:hypothetical protein